MISNKRGREGNREREASAKMECVGIYLGIYFKMWLENKKTSCCSLSSLAPLLNFSFPSEEIIYIRIQDIINKEVDKSFIYRRNFSVQNLTSTGYLNF
jgi:hypothetical protein